MHKYAYLLHRARALWHVRVILCEKRHEKFVSVPT